MTGVAHIHQSDDANGIHLQVGADLGQPVTGRHVARFLCAQTILLGLRGVPAIYLPSLLAASSDHIRAETTGNPRATNRRRWLWPDLAAILSDPAHHETRIFQELLRRCKLRRSHPVFHPGTPQLPLDLGSSLLGLRRTTLDGSETLAAVSNLSLETQPLIPENLIPDLHHYPVKQELITGLHLEGREGQALVLEPYQTVWLLGAYPQTP